MPTLCEHHKPGIPLHPSGDRCHLTHESTDEHPRFLGTIHCEHILHHRQHRFAKLRESPFCLLRRKAARADIEDAARQQRKQQQNQQRGRQQHPVDRFSFLLIATAHRSHISLFHISSPGFRMGTSRTDSTKAGSTGHSKASASQAHARRSLFHPRSPAASLFVSRKP